jgi:hypothetical protein
LESLLLLTRPSCCGSTAASCCLACPSLAEARRFLAGRSFNSLLRRDVLLVALAALSADDWRLATDKDDEFRWLKDLESMVWLGKPAERECLGDVLLDFAHSYRHGWARSAQPSPARGQGMAANLICP